MSTNTPNPELPSIPETCQADATRTAHCADQDCDFEVSGSATAPVAASHAANTGHRVTVTQTLRFDDSEQPAEAGRPSQLCVDHEAFAEVDCAVQLLSECCLSSCRHSFTDDETPIQNAQAHAKYHPTRVDIVLTLRRRTDDDAGQTEDDQVLASLH